MSINAANRSQCDLHGEKDLRGSKKDDTGYHSYGALFSIVNEATKLRVTTISEREALDWVKPGTYTVSIESGAISVSNTVLAK